MGISPQPSGDFWRTSAMISSFGSPETNRVRRNAANSAVFSTIGTVVYGDSTCWLGQQCRCCSALPSFPANWEFYWEFCKIAPSGAPETANSAVFTGLPIGIPYSINQGNILADAVNSGAGTGMFTRAQTCWRRLYRWTA